MYSFKTTTDHHMWCDLVKDLIYKLQAEAVAVRPFDLESEKKLPSGVKLELASGHGLLSLSTILAEVNDAQAQIPTTVLSISAAQRALG